MDAFGCCFPLCQVAVNNETGFPGRGQISGASAIKEIAAHADPSDTGERGREREEGRRSSASLSVITGAVFQRLPGETTRREEDFTFLLPDSPPHPPRLSYHFHSSAALPSHPSTPPTPQTFLIISSPKYCGSVTKELTLMHVLINPQTLETRLTKILRKG